MSRAPAAALLAVALAASACGIDKRTSAFRCETDSDCDGDRRCEEGYCTVGPRDLADATPGAADAPFVPIIDASPPDAFDCPDACTGGCLEDFTCVIDCSADASCADPIVCPPGLPCQVSCTGLGSCVTTIDCTAATDCDITCTADGSCSGAVSCAVGEECDVLCVGASSCAAGVSCAGSCSCEVGCTGTDSCATASTCPPAPQDRCETGNGCNATGHPSCDEC
ncbi:MAG TPA: hypothetical protein VFU21_26005 [Kofleriaceae bacterium]|nr:hypothetical protein [Kofleriaceae bacterium]